MTTRSVFAMILGSLMATTYTTDMARSAEESLAAACPILVANIVLHDYNGTHTAQMCVSPQGLSITAGAVNLTAYDNGDGIFHNGFELGP